jgi:hypothetical protein
MNDAPDTSTKIEQAIVSGISSDQAIEALKVQSAQITTEFMGWLKDAASDAASFVAGQTPLFVQEFLSWHFYRACLYSFLTLVPVILLLVVFGHFWKWSKELKPVYDMDMGPKTGKIMSLLLFIPIGLIFCFGTMGHAEEAIKIKVAPRVYLVDWLSETVRGQNFSDANSQPVRK